MPRRPPAASTWITEPRREPGTRLLLLFLFFLFEAGRPLAEPPGTPFPAPPPTHPPALSQVCALLGELAALRSQDPGAKAVVFSSWGRLLRLVAEALSANGVGHAMLAGAAPAARAAALGRFARDPRCGVLLVVMSTAGGAAGLSLTAARAAFLLEPTLNPGLEAQAAARVYRLGEQTYCLVGG